MTYRYPSIKYLGPAYPDGSVRPTVPTLVSRDGHRMQLDLLGPERAARRWPAVTEHQDQRGALGSGWR
jgi:hypothetical protein